MLSSRAAILRVEQSPCQTITIIRILGSGYTLYITHVPEGVDL
jgi:hypothetical protein